MPICSAPSTRRIQAGFDVDVYGTTGSDGLERLPTTPSATQAFRTWRRQFRARRAIRTQSGHSILHVPVSRRPRSSSGASPCCELEFRTIEVSINLATCRNTSVGRSRKTNPDCRCDATLKIRNYAAPQPRDLRALLPLSTQCATPTSRLLQA